MGQCGLSDQLSIPFELGATKKSHETDVTENLERLGLGWGNPTPKMTQLLQLFFLPHPKKLILSVRIWDKYSTPAPNPPKEFFQHEGMESQLLLICR